MKHEVGRCSEIQFFFFTYLGLRLCGHVTYKTPKIIKDKDNERKMSGLECRQCVHAAGGTLLKAVSSYEATTWQAVKGCFSGHMLVETSVLGGNWPIADIWLPWFENSQQRLDLIIMVDGETHFDKPRKVTKLKQMRIDHAFNHECWNQEHKLLRLHCKDQDDWEQQIMRALARAQAQPANKFRQFSANYKDLRSENDKEEAMSFHGQRDTGAFFKNE